MTLDEFEAVVIEAIDSLPEAFGHRLDEVSIEVADQATPAELARLTDTPAPPHDGPQPYRRPRSTTILGYHQGVSPLQRSVMSPYELPARIVIFRKPHLALFGRSPQLLRAEILKTVYHEIGHAFGLSEDQLQHLGYG